MGTATAVYGLYTFFVYVLSLPGGWLADKLWGQRRAVFIGGVIIALGHFSMAIPLNETFFLGLALIVVGTGLLKPNVSTMVGELYPEGGARRDAGFSIFYMGINIGAVLGPTLCGLLGEGYNWHLGFSLAGIGMVAGLISYKLGEKYLARRDFSGRRPVKMRRCWHNGPDVSTRGPGLPPPWWFSAAICWPPDASRFRWRRWRRAWGWPW